MRPYSALAQLVEQLTVNQRVAGSSPAGGAIFFNDLHTFQLTSIFPVWGICGYLVSGAGRSSSATMVVLDHKIE